MTHYGACGSTNVGTSNHNAGEIPARRKSKVFFAMIINEELVGPKGMARAGPDGQKVNIPLLLYTAMGGRRAVAYACHWICVCIVRKILRQIRESGFNTAFKQCIDLRGNPREYT